jgi:hypothetical protein
VVVGEEDEDGVVSAGDMGVMTYIASKAAVLVLAGLQPPHYFLLLAFWERLLKGCERCERPVSSCDFEVFGEVFSY